MYKAAFFHKDNKKLDLKLYKSMFAGTHCSLGVSVGQKYHEKYDLIATIELLNNSKFGFCTFHVADKLQRYTKQIRGCSIEESEIQSIKEGDEWIEKNIKEESAILKKLKIPYKIIRWSEWLNHPQFLRYKKYVEDQYRDDKYFEDAFNKSVNLYVGREKSRNVNIDEKKIKELTFEYVKEEVIVAFLWEEYDYNYIAYPGSFGSIMQYVFQSIQKSHLDKLLLNFLNIKSTKITCFFEENKSISEDVQLKNNQEKKNKNSLSDKKFSKFFIIKLILNQVDTVIDDLDPDEKKEVLIELGEAINSRLPLCSNGFFNS